MIWLQSRCGGSNIVCTFCHHYWDILLKATNGTEVNLLHEPGNIPIIFLHVKKRREKLDLKKKNNSWKFLNGCKYNLNFLAKCDYQKLEDNIIRISWLEWQSPLKDLIEKFMFVETSTKFSWKKHEKHNLKVLYELFNIFPHASYSYHSCYYKCLFIL